MARKSLIAALVLMLIFSMSVFAFPYISNAVYNKNKLQTKTHYQQQASSLSQEEIDERIKEAREYNQQLIDSGVILTEPFDPIQSNLDEKYDSLLSDTEEMGYISIPSLDLNLPIYHSTDEEVLQKGVGHLYHTSLPVGGASTNCVLSAHCGLPNAELFTHIDKLQNGNTFTIQVYNET
ncbi:MAG: class C sortase, partial [Floccifex sp.]